MAVLTADQLADIRHGVAGSGVAINYDKTQANAAGQAIEDWFEQNRPQLSAAIDAATAPKVLTAAQKRAFVAFWLQSKFNRGG